MNRHLICLIALTSIFGTQVQAQGYSPHFSQENFQENENNVTGGVFFRIKSATSSSRNISFESGIGIYRTQNDEIFAPSYNPHLGTSGIEYRFGQENGGIWAIGQTQTCLDDTFHQNGANIGGDNKALYVVGGILAVAVIAVALAPDKKPTMCSGNTIPNPISGRCEPLQF